MTCSCEHHRNNDDEMFMNICKEFATKSHCISKHVASIAVRDGRILCSGINGTSPKQTNCCDAFHAGVFTREEHHAWSLLNEIHSEIALLQYAAREGISLKGATIYCTLQPCQYCSIALSNIGIERIVYGTSYEHTPADAGRILTDSGIILETINKQD